MSESEISAVEQAKTVLSQEGIVLPPFQKKHVGNLKAVAPTVFSTLEDAAPSPYDYLLWLESALAGNLEAGLTFGFAGHGFSSTAFHYYLVDHRFALLLQIAWGGLHSEDIEHGRNRIEEILGDMENIRRALAKNADQDIGGDGDRLLVALSDFSESGAGWVTRNRNVHAPWEITPFPVIRALNLVNRLF